jgi:hypothetical protein
MNYYGSSRHPSSRLSYIVVYRFSFYLLRGQPICSKKYKLHELPHLTGGHVASQLLFAVSVVLRQTRLSLSKFSDEQEENSSDNIATSPRTASCLQSSRCHMTIMRMTRHVHVITLALHKETEN